MFRRSVERRNDSTLRSADAPDLAAMPTSFGARFALAIPTISGTSALLADV